MMGSGRKLDYSNSLAWFRRDVARRSTMVRTAIVLVIALCASNFALSEEEDVDQPASRMIALEEVPAPALKAAREAKPDVFFKSAETVWWNDEHIYHIMGAKFRTDWSVYVNVEGEIFHISSDVREK